MGQNERPKISFEKKEMIGTVLNEDPRLFPILLLCNIDDVKFSERGLKHQQYKLQMNQEVNDLDQQNRIHFASYCRIRLIYGPEIFKRVTF